MLEVPVSPPALQWRVWNQPVLVALFILTLEALLPFKACFRIMKIISMKDKMF